MNPKKILIIDDDQVIAEIYQGKFRMAGYEAEVAAEGASALEMLKKAPVDLVLLDLSLPGMNGLEVLKQVRARPETQRLPVIVFSNTYLTNLMQAARKAGATQCVSKASCTPREMLDIVGRIFAARAAVQKPAATIPSPIPAFPGSGTSTAQSEMEFQTGLVQAFLTSAPETIVAMRKRYQTFVKLERENLRLVDLNELYRLARSLAGAAGVVGFRMIAQLSSALEALLQEMHARPAEMTPSTNRTIAQAVDKLARLVTHAGTLTGQAEAPTSPLVLVVDDESVSREITVRAVGKAGLRALSLDNSTLALQVLEQNCFDLVFLDIGMPKPSGIEVCECLRKMPLNRTTPVVFVTAEADFESRAQSSLSGGNDFIAKPFLVLELAVKALTWLHSEDIKPLAMAMAGAAAPGKKNQEPPPVPAWPLRPRESAR